MPVDRELIEVVTVANMAGVDAAQKGFLGLSASALALAAVLGGAIIVGKAAIENYNAQEEALKLLRQATDAAGESYAQVEADVESFIQANKSSIASQYDVIAAMGQIVRAGHSESESMRILNDSLDYAVIKHEDVSAAASVLIKVLAGNSRALKELGITTEEYNAIMKSKMTIEEKDAALLELIEKHTAKGRDTVDNMSASQRRLNTDWQNFTAKIGPGLVEVQTQFNTALDTGIQILDLADQYLVKLGQDANNPVWGKLQGFLEVIAGKPVQDGLRALLALLGASGSTTQSAPSGGNQRVRGGLTPSGASNGVQIVIQGGMFMDHGPTIDALTNKIAQRLASVSGL